MTTQSSQNNRTDVFSIVNNRIINQIEKDLFRGDNHGVKRVLPEI